jgi:hypothetical protein
MRSRAIILDGTAQKLMDAFGSDEYCRSVTIQNPSGNSVLLWGDAASQPMSLAAGDMISIPVTSLKNLYINGTNTDVINVSIFT